MRQMGMRVSKELEKRIEKCVRAMKHRPEVDAAGEATKSVVLRLLVLAGLEQFETRLASEFLNPKVAA